MKLVFTPCFEYSCHTCSLKDNYIQPNLGQSSWSPNLRALRFCFRQKLITQDFLRFYREFYETLASAGVAGVKCDGQFLAEVLVGKGWLVFFTRTHLHKDDHTTCVCCFLDQHAYVFPFVSTEVVQTSDLFGKFVFI